MESKTWKLYELQEGGFEDRDGSILSRVSDQDAHEGFYRAYVNVVCHQPGHNGALVGINYPGLS
jgi:hypothetical protein